ncbi:hypothetical protein [Vogesella indigofera]|uniref:hypothetical protein n=1 Tax=Vogesella indigofera TaxID=45465 RepID=UPI0035B1C78B
MTTTLPPIGGLEFASFRLRPGVSEHTLRQAAQAVEQHLLRHQPGFVSHTLWRGDDDSYVDLVLADSHERAVALCELWPDDPHGAHFLSLLAPGSALLAFYRRVA